MEKICTRRGRLGISSHGDRMRQNCSPWFTTLAIRALSPPILSRFLLPQFPHSSAAASAPSRCLPITRSTPSSSSSPASRRHPRPPASGHQDQGRAVSQPRKSGSGSHGRARLVFVGSGEAGRWVSAAIFLGGALAVPRRLSPFPLVPTNASLLVAPNLDSWIGQEVVMRACSKTHW
jgi:hypothetical protein